MGSDPFCNPKGMSNVWRCGVISFLKDIEEDTEIVERGCALLGYAPIGGQCRGPQKAHLPLLPFDPPLHPSHSISPHAGTPLANRFSSTEMHLLICLSSCFQHRQLACKLCVYSTNARCLAAEIGVLCLATKARVSCILPGGHLIRSVAESKWLYIPLQVISSGRKPM